MNRYALPLFSRISPLGILLLFVGLIIAHHFFAYPGHFGFDDMHYARLSNRLLLGNFDFDDHFSYRLSVILLTSLSYLFFGISDFSSSLPAMLVAIFVLALVYRVLLPFGRVALAFGLAITTLSSWFLFYADKLMPDIYVALSVIAALVVIYRLRFSARPGSNVLLAALFAFALLFGFMAKETIVLSAPLFGFVLLHDLIKKQNLPFWGWAFTFGAILLGVYFTSIGLVTGNPFHRFSAIVGNSYLNACSYDQQPTAVLIRRIGIDFFSMMIHHGMAVPFIFIVGAAVVNRAKGIFSLRDKTSFFITSAWILMLAANFMSISLTSYVPMCVDPRHYLYLIPVSAIAASITMRNILFINKKNTVVFASLALLCGIEYFFQGRGWSLVYFPLFVLLCLGLWFDASLQNKRIFLFVFVLILMGGHYKGVRYAHDIQFRQQSIWLKNEVLSLKKGIVVTDKVQAHFGEYYSGFADADSLRFVRFEFFSKEDVGNDVYVLLNPHTQYLSRLHPMDIPFYVRFMSDDNVLVKQDERLGMKLYRMHNFSEPGERGEHLIQAVNTLNPEDKYWDNKPGQVIDRIDGYDCLKTGMYSSSFAYPLDSILSVDPYSLYISVEVQSYFSDDVDAKLVVMVEDTSGAYIWNDLPVNRFIETIGHWWPAYMNATISGEAIRPNSTLKVFLFNYSRGDVYVKDFGVDIFKLPNR